MEGGKVREIEVKFCLDEELSFHGGAGEQVVHNEGYPSI